MPRNPRDNDVQLDDPDTDATQLGPDSAGQSGDTQGLSSMAEAADESVEELADSGQSYESDVISGVEDAADHPERPVFSHEDPSWVSDVEPDRDSD